MVINDTYNRLIKSALVEQILSHKQIYVDVNELSHAIIKHKITKSVDNYNEIIRIYKLSKNTGYFTTEYYSRDKTTFRLFNKSGSINMITLSNPDIMKSIISRYKNGKLVELDYQSFEYSIIKHILKLEDAPDDIHTETRKILPWLSRNDVKLLNNSLFYGKNIEDILSQLRNNKNYSESAEYEYLSIMIPIIEKINKFTRINEDYFTLNSYILNSYGRKLYPKNIKNIFNNIIQSNGSEILIDVLLQLEGINNINFIFHRFDAIFFDLSSINFKDNIEKAKEIMESPGGGIKLKTNMKIGNNLYDLRK